MVRDFQLHSNENYSTIIKTGKKIVQNIEGWIFPADRKGSQISLNSVLDVVYNNILCVFFIFYYYEFSPQFRWQSFDKANVSETKIHHKSFDELFSMYKRNVIVGVPFVFVSLTSLDWVHISNQKMLNKPIDTRANYKFEFITERQRESRRCGQLGYCLHRFNSVFKSRLAKIFTHIFIHSFCSHFVIYNMLSQWLYDSMLYLYRCANKWLFTS